jgi:hypothetical protein
VQNKFGKNPISRPGYAGEHHVILPTKYGPTLANYAGPGTNYQARFKRGDQGVDGPNGIDQISKGHDRAYVNARTVKDIRDADNKMIDEVRHSSAGPRTKQVVIAALKAKKFGEDKGAFDVNTFTQVIPPENMDVSGSGKKKRKKKKKKRKRGPLPSDRLMTAFRKREKKAKLELKKDEMKIIPKVLKRKAEWEACDLMPGLLKKVKIALKDLAKC